MISDVFTRRWRLERKTLTPVYKEGYAPAVIEEYVGVAISSNKKDLEKMVCPEYKQYYRIVPYGR